MSRTCCEITDQAFSEDEARHEARLYRRRGPASHTHELLKAIRSFGFKDATLLDIGGGIGAIHHELVGDVVGSAVHVDASSAYLKEARAETTGRGHEDRVRFIHADFTDVAADVPEADIVTLDRVVCCYPDFGALLTAAARRCRRVLALSYPRESWITRLGLNFINLIQRLRRDPFRAYLHPVAAMEDLLRAEGLHRASSISLLVWEIAIFAR